ncbi:MAG: chloride channel protein, partial [Myxococcales bacterium]|nr:chloride channel protein [Myxococcales bacterium]
DIEHEVLVPAIIASTVAHGLFMVSGAPALFLVPPVAFRSGLELLPYTALGAVLAVGAWAFVTAHRQVRARIGQSSRYPHWLRPALGGLGVGLIGVLFPAVLGRGYGIIELALSADGAAGMLLALALAKLAATALTVGSGGAGGLFAPSLVIGGALGGLVGQLASHALPDLGIAPASFVVVGMAGFFAAVSNAPLSTVIMVSELSGSYRLVVPTLWVCTLTWLLARKVSLFDAQVPTRVDAPFRLADMMGAVLHRMTVRDALGDAPEPPVTVPPNLPLRDLVELFAHTPQAVFPILDANGRMQGVVDGRLLRRTLAERGVDTLLIANDFESDATLLRADASLYDAITAMTTSGYDELPVVQADGTLLGILSRRQVVNAYHRRMLDRATPEEPTPPDAGDEGVDLAAAIQRGGVLHDVPGATPDAVLAAMVERARLGPGCDAVKLLQLLRDRESLMSTGVGEGLALPHPHAQVLPGIDKPRVVIGLLAEPVDWQAFDGAPVDTVCLLLGPSGDVHLELLGALARALHDPALRTLLKQRADGAAIIERIQALEPAHAP